LPTETAGQSNTGGRSVLQEAIDEERLIRRLTWRLMPLLTTLFLVAFIDRQNVGFAKLQMVGALGISEAEFGLASSLFFISYLVFEIPSTLALHRFGARNWLARIMFTWGLVTVLMAFVWSGTGFTALRLLLGIAEAGLYPGILYTLTLWFPQRYRTRVLGIFTLGSALGNMLGALIGGPLLGWLADSVGARAPVVIGGVACLAAAAFGALTTRRTGARPGASHARHSSAPLP